MNAAVLDDAVALAGFDRSGMLEAIASLPAQLREGWARTRGLTLPASHRGAHSVAVLGMGGSAIAGDLVRGVFAERLRVPLITIRDYELPAFAGPGTLVVASSYSGATEETIAALLERAGYVALSNAEVEAAARAAEAVVAANMPAVPTESNAAKQLAWSVVGRLPIVEAAGFLAPVARRWKTQLNENGKTSASWEELPEATHNAVVGYAEPEPLREHLFVVFLASPDDHPRNALRAAVSAELLASSQIGHQVVPVAGPGRLAQACHAIVLGDFVSAYLAVLYGQDPTPVEAIATVRARLSVAIYGPQCFN